MLFNALKKLDNYRSGIALGLIGSMVLVGLMIPFQSGFLVGEWFLDILIIPALIARLIASVGFIFRLGDMATINERTHTLWSLINFKRIPVKRPISSFEKVGTLLGALVGLGIAITIILLKAKISFADGFLGDFAYALYSLGLLGIFAGLGNRLGFILGHRLGFSSAKSRHSSEVRLIAIAALLGLVFGLIVVLLLGPGAILIPGILPFLALGTLPVGFMSTVFVLTIISIFASAADYSGKAASYLLVHLFKSNRLSLKENMKGRGYEYLGASLGVFLGLALGLTVVLALVLTHSAILAPGLLGAAMGVVLVLTSMSMVGGLGSRLCRLVDAALPEKEELSVLKAVVEAVPAEVSSPGNGVILAAASPAKKASSSCCLRFFGNPAAFSGTIQEEKIVNSVDTDNEQDRLVVEAG